MLKSYRPSKDIYYLDVAEIILRRASCMRRNFGAVIVNNDQIVSCGYTGAPRGQKDCLKIGNCMRKKLNIPSGEKYELCRSVHAEANAIIHASRDKSIGSTLYLVGIEAENGEYVKKASPCSMCKRFIINAGIFEIIIRETKDYFRKVKVSSWLNNEFVMK